MLRLTGILLLALLCENCIAQQTNCKSYYNKTLKKTIFTLVSEEPKFPGGPSEKARFISKNLKLPELNDDDALLQSSVIVKLVIDTDGTIKHSDVEKKTNRDVMVLEFAVLQMVDKMPKWIPARCDGQAVAAEFTFPIIICFTRQEVLPSFTNPGKGSACRSIKEIRK
jgi:hypothetical protein